MSWNLNNKSADYKLSGLLTAELIDMYGLSVKFVRTELVNVDEIFNESTNLNANIDDVFDVMIKPENPDLFEEGNFLSKFGFSSVSSINLFISLKSIEKVYEDAKYAPHAVGALIMLPSGKWLEVVSIDVQVPGINNMFLYSNQKNVFLLKCKPYSYNNDDVVDVMTEVHSEVGDIGDIIPDLSQIFNLDIYEEKKVAIEQQSTKGTEEENYDPIFGELG